MRLRTQMAVMGGFLLVATALFSVRREPRFDAGRPEGARCCPLRFALDATPVTASANHITTNIAAQQVIAYYLHGTVRCETCLKIERQAKGVIEQQFSAELAANRLMFTPVNYELPENAHFLTDYKLPCPSLVLVRQKGGKDDKSKLLGETWQLAHDPEKLNRYVETEVRRFLGGQEQDTSTNKFDLPPAQGPR